MNNQPRPPFMNQQRPPFVQQARPAYRPPPPGIQPGQPVMQQGPVTPPVAQLENMHIGSSSPPSVNTKKTKRVYAQVPSVPTTPQQQPVQAPLYQQPPVNPQDLQKPLEPLYESPPAVPNTPLGLPPRSTAKPRIDPDQIPSPVASQSKDEALHQQSGYFFGTCTKELPLASTDFKCLDQGNANPRFMRATLNTVPHNAELLKETGLPFGVVIQPLAKLHPEDHALPVVELNGKEEPTRCNRCKAYLNPWCKYIDAGKKYICNLCEFSNTVQETEYCPADSTGRRMDTDTKPELMMGSVEFEVSEAYWARELQPQPLQWLFAVDVSLQSIKSGVLQAFCESLTAMLDDVPQGIKIGIVTYDTSIHFYNLKGEQASMMVVPSILDVFVPMAEDSLFVDPRTCKSTLLDLLRSLPALHASTRINDSAFGSLLQSALLAMTHGGKLTVFQSSLPRVGTGIVRGRDDPTLYGTDSEKSLFAPQGTFYTQLGVDFAKRGLSVDLWLFPTEYVDVATLGVVAALSGGNTQYFRNFSMEKQKHRVIHNMLHSVVREQGYSAALRLRCSNGLSVASQFGNFHMSNATDIELAGVNADTSVGFTLKHDGKVTDVVCLQAALLYTTAQGARRVRVHNWTGTVASTANLVFKEADLDTSMNLLVKQTIAATAKKSLSELSNELDNYCVKILTAYRKHCASGASPAQLILPEAFKVLPLLLSSLKKSDILRKDAALNADTRVYNLRKIKNLSIPGTIQWLYPRLIPIHTLLAQPDQPHLIRLAYDRFDPSGVYWLQSHSHIFLWIGKHSTLLQPLFGVTEPQYINPFMDPNDLTHPLLKELYAKATETAYLPQFVVVRHGLDLEVELANRLVEDEVLNQMSYVDYLCMIHKQIQTELEREKQDTVISSASYWAHRY